MKILNEKFSSDKVDVLAKKVEEFTDSNAFGEAIKEVAVFIKDKEAIKAIDAVLVLHDFYGHMPKELNEIRSFIKDRVMKQLKNQTAEEDYIKVARVF